MNCLRLDEVIDLAVLEKRKHEADYKKYSVLSITDSMWTGLIGDLANVGGRESLQQIKDVVGNDNVTKGPLSELGKSSVMILPGKQLFADTDSATTIKIKAIAMRELLDAYSSQEDIVTQALLDGVSKEKIEELRDPDTGLVNIAGLSIAPTIGRKIAQALGMTMSQKTYAGLGKNRAAQLAGEYAKIGNEALKVLADVGFVNITEKSQASPLLLTKSKNGKYQIENYVGTHVALNTEALSLEQASTEMIHDAIVNRDDSQGAMSKLSGIQKQVRALSTLALPSNSKIGALKAKDNLVDKGEFASKQSPKQLKQLEAMSKLGTTVQPYVLKLLKELQSIKKILEDKAAKDEYVNYHTIVDEVVKQYGIGDAVRVELFAADRQAIQTSANKGAEISRQNSKIAPLKEILDNIDHFVAAFDGNGLYTGHGVGQNDRLITMLMGMNHQSTKAHRDWLAGTSQTLKLNKNDEGYRFVNANLLAEHGVTMEMHDQGFIDEIVNKWEELENRPTGTLEMVKYIIDSPGVSAAIKGNTAIGKLNAIQLLLEYRKGMKENKDSIVTTYATAIDAKGSGLVIKALLNLGRDEGKRLYKILTKLGILSLEDGDVYLAGIDEARTQSAIDGTDLNEELDKVQLKDIYYILEIASSKTTNNTEVKVMNALLDGLMELGDGQMFGGDLREFLKRPTMTFIYGQGEAGRAANIGEFIVQDAIGNEAKMKRLLKLAPDLKVELLDNGLMSNEDLAKLAAHYGETLGAGINTLLGDSLGKAFEATDKKMTEQYNKAADIAKSRAEGYEVADISMLSGAVWMERETILKEAKINTKDMTDVDKYIALRLLGYGNKMSKARTVIEQLEDKTWVEYTQDQANVTSVLVVPQHMVDRQQLDGMYQPILAQKGFRGTAASTHDQMITDYKSAILAKKGFEDTTKEIALNYDPLLMMEMEVAFAKHQTGQDTTLVGESVEMSAKQKEIIDKYFTGNELIGSSLEIPADTKAPKIPKEYAEAKKEAAKDGVTTETRDQIKNIAAVARVKLEDYKKIIKDKALYNVDIETLQVGNEQRLVQIHATNMITGKEITIEVTPVRDNDTKDKIDAIALLHTQNTTGLDKYIGNVPAYDRENVKDVVGATKQLTDFLSETNGDKEIAIAGHNVNNFELNPNIGDGVVAKVFADAAKNKKEGVVDTLELAKALRVNGNLSYKQGDLAARVLTEYSTDDAHAAKYDVEKNIEILDKIVEHMEQITQAENVAKYMTTTAVENNLFNIVDEVDVEMAEKERTLKDRLKNDSNSVEAEVEGLRGEITAVEVLIKSGALDIATENKMKKKIKIIEEFIENCMGGK